MSRVTVQVVLRIRTSISPVWSAGPRSSALSARNWTLVESPRTAAATARQKSTSKPDQVPVPSSRKLKPGSPPFTPQISSPRAWTVARRPVTGAAVGAVVVFGWLSQAIAKSATINIPVANLNALVMVFSSF